MMTTDRTAIRRRLAIRRRAHRPPARAWKGAGIAPFLRPWRQRSQRASPWGGRRDRQGGQGAAPGPGAAARPLARPAPRRERRGGAAAHGARAGRHGDRAARGGRQLRRRPGGPRDPQGAQAPAGAGPRARERARAQDAPRERTAPWRRRPACWPAPATRRYSWRRWTRSSSVTRGNSPGIRASRGCAAASRPSTSASWRARWGTRRPGPVRSASCARCASACWRWNLSDRQGIVLVEPGLLRLYRQGRRRWERCERRKGDETREMHQWRKRVKDLRYAAEILQSAPAARRPARARGASRSSSAGSHRERTRSGNCSARTTTSRCSRSGSGPTASAGEAASGARRAGRCSS